MDSTRLAAMKRAFIALAPLLCAPAFVMAFEVGEFASGMSREQVRTLLSSWKFDRQLETGADSLLVYDLPESAASRQYLFRFCKNRLAAFEQDVQPGLRPFVIVVGNYSAKYGQPYKTYAESHVISTGERNTVSLFWRAQADYVGVRYSALPYGEQLTLVFETNNPCWQAPRL
jgi:hypothetical protein